MPIQFRLVDFNDVHQYEEQPHRVTRRSARCLCGRFAKPGRPPQMDMNGEYPFSVHCTTCGEVWIS